MGYDAFAFAYFDNEKYRLESRQIMIVLGCPQGRLELVC